jgi:5-methylcytosine-specific restriction endonuclease McrA
MAKPGDRLDEVVRQARRDAEQRAQGYRAKALKLYPWVCGVCGRTFTHANLQLLEVHHKNGNHDDNPPDGSNWELLCTYCHENEHSKFLHSAAGERSTRADAPATHSPFADLRARLDAKKS